MGRIGWVKLHRKLIGSRVFVNEGLLKVWIYCLCRANHETNYVPLSTGKGTTEIKVTGGQFIFGRNKCAQDLNMNPSTLYKRMKKLEDMGNINMQSNTHCSVVSVCNWETYQTESTTEEQAKEHPSSTQVTGKEQPSNTEKNDNNDKNEKNINIPFSDFWDAYAKKVGSKSKSKKKWKALDDDERSVIMEHIENYKSTFSDKQYQPYPETFLNGKHWESEGYKSEYNQSTINWGLS